MKISPTEGCGIAPPSRRLAVLAAVAALGIGPLCPSARAQATPKHASAPTHQTLMDYAVAKAGELATPLTFPGKPGARLREAAYDEDNPVTRSLNHAFNPLTDAGFAGASMNARDAALDYWNSMAAAFVSGDRDGGDGSGAWHFLGRASHLLQDMSSPLHAFALWHTGVTEPGCKFEGYWENNDPSLRSILASIGAPLLSSALDAKASEKLDAFTSQRLTYRFNNSCPHKSSDDVRGYLEVLAWITYFRASFWGQVSFGSSGSSGAATTASTTATSFADGTVNAQPNTLHTMFNGQVQWIAGFLDNYYEITDRNGYLFRWMSWTDIDDWSACGRSWADGYQDGSKRPVGNDDDSRGARITGRFWFDVRELGKDTSGSYNRYCYPHYHPDGTAMTDHLHQYYGRHLYPLTVRYNAGLLGLANRRVTVKTADATPGNGFAWGRPDNFGNGPTFNTASNGQHFYFAAKSPVTLTAPAVNAGGWVFLRWLREAAAFAGNASRTITINDSTQPIGAGGVTYTAEYAGAGGVQLTAPGMSNQVFGFVLNGPVGSNYVIKVSTNLVNWSPLSTNAIPAAGWVAITDLATTNVPRQFYRAVAP